MKAHATERAPEEGRDTILPFRSPVPTRIGFNSFVFRHPLGLLELASERYPTDDARWVDPPVFVDPMNPHESFTIRLTDLATGVSYPLASWDEASDAHPGA